MTDVEYPTRYTPSNQFPSKLSTAECDAIIARVLADDYYSGPRGRLSTKVVKQLEYRSPRMRKIALDAVARFEALLAREGYFGPDQVPRGK